MIISRIIGGLGNQLFQYAAGLSLASHHKTTLKLDLSAYSGVENRPFDLEKLQIPFSKATASELKPFQKKSLLSRVQQRLLPPQKRQVYKEPYFHFDPQFFEAPADSYIKGYWQSWRYFTNVETELRQQYQVRPEMVSQLKAYAASLQDHDTVAVHIRRGDYTQPTALKHHGLIEANYYNEALGIIEKQYPEAKVLFFSDDINWVKGKINTGLQHEFITGIRTQNALEDFYLMQHCRHQVIANSSFGWWAAWLNPNLEKKVIAPKNWFADTKLNTRDLIPPTWMQV